MLSLIITFLSLNFFGQAAPTLADLPGCGGLFDTAARKLQSKWTYHSEFNFIKNLLSNQALIAKPVIKKSRRSRERNDGLLF